MDYLVVYTSKTGNTQKVAMKIFETLPGKSKDIIRLEEIKISDADTYFVGFWNDRGTCSANVIEFLSGLHRKRVALFGTSGMCGSPEYYKKVENQVSVFIPDDNEYLGCFMCGGKMMPQVLEKYRSIQKVQDTPQIRAMISGYESAMLHPGKEDFEMAGQFVKKALQLTV